MKRELVYSIVVLVQLGLFCPVSGLGMGSEPQASQVGGSALDDPVANAKAAMNQAAEDLKKAGAEFGGHGAQSQQSAATSWSQATSPQNIQDGTAQPDPRQQALQGSSATGYAGTWTDPATGDVVTSVIAPAPQPAQSQNYPIIVEPQVSGNAYSGNQYYGWQGGYGNSGWSQWPTSPDNPGYPPNAPSQNVPYNQPPPPGWHAPYPGQPYPGFNPYPYQGPLGWQPYPGYGPPHPGGNAIQPGQPGFMPPPFPPGYRPLRPNAAPGNMPAPGWQQPGASNPGGIWQPGLNPPGNAGPAPGIKPLPMQPSGNTWNNSRPPAGRGGVFGGRGGF